MRWLKKNLVNILLFIMLIFGIGLIAYPTVADYWNKYHQSQAITKYVEAIANCDTEEYQRVLNSAIEYNQMIAREGINMNLSGNDLQEYNEQLNITGDGMMGYIEIEKINCYLPIYHGTDEKVLMAAVGHIDGSSLPVGGASTHCILSGHRGLPSAKLFTDLDKMEEGDHFVLRTMDEILTYEVDQILIVEPSDTSSLGVETGKDLVTLVTCTPYGVNSHRLLVRGHRVPNDYNSDGVMVASEAIQIDVKLVAPFVAAPILLLLIIFVLFAGGESKKKKEDVQDESKELEHKERKKKIQKYLREHRVKK